MSDQEDWRDLQPTASSLAIEYKRLSNQNFDFRGTISWILLAQSIV